MHQLQRARRDIAGMSTGAWAMVCGCAFVVAMGAGLGVFTPTRLGVEDFQQEDDDRDISAVRNLYAGLLLLAKEALVRKAPDADPKTVIGATFKPIPNGDGGIDFVQTGHRTIDFDTIAKRFADFELTIDSKALSELNSIRNDMEHHYADRPGGTIRAAMVKAFPVISILFHQMDESPAQRLGEAWNSMLEQRSLYEHEFAAARASLAKVDWHADFLAESNFECAECGLDLVEQVDAANEVQSSIQFRCRNCAGEPERGSVIEAAVEKKYGVEAYIRVREGEGQGPVYRCGACELQTYLEDEDICANCGEQLDFDRKCGRCNAGISIQDYLDGLDSGLCSYCNYISEKVMRE